MKNKKPCWNIVRQMGENVPIEKKQHILINEYRTMPCYPTALTLQVAIYNCESQVSSTTISWKSHSLGSCSGHTHAQSNGGKVQIILPWAPGLRL